MRTKPSDIAFTASVKAIQVEKGSRESYERMEAGSGWETEVSSELADFLGERDMFYLGTSNAAGQPYIQYRGGVPGFLKVLDRKTLGFADFSGNRQYISVGNLAENPQAFIFLMDYENRRRVKIWGTARVIENDEAILAKLVDRDYPGRAERAILFEISAWDINCPQHIHRRFGENRVSGAIEKLKERISQLEAELAKSRSIQH